MGRKNTVWCISSSLQKQNHKNKPTHCFHQLYEKERKKTEGKVKKKKKKEKTTRACILNFFGSWTSPNKTSRFSM